MKIDSLVNPFETKQPEFFTASLIHKLFVEDYTEHTALIGRYHTFIYGSRGSGKSMHFKYLEPECQILKYKNIEEYFKSENAFIGIYINCNKGDQSKTDLDNIMNDQSIHSAISQKVLMHYFMIDIAECVLKTFIEQLSSFSTPEKEASICAAILGGYFNERTYDPKDVVSLVALKKFLHSEKQNVDNAITAYQENHGCSGNRLKMGVENYLSPSLEEGSFLNTLLTMLKQDLPGGDSVPFYFLFDEANELLDFQKKIINTMISSRRDSLVCVKISCQQLLYNVYTDIKERSISETHDYYHVDLDSLYTNDRNAYYSRLKIIAERRLKIAGFKQESIEEFLPANPTEKIKEEEAREQASNEYDALPDGKKPKNKGNYIKKYARARLFQDYFAKTAYSYAGFENLVHFSSGIVRTFLQPCFDMVGEHKKHNPNVDIRDIDFIPVNIQKSKIENYSNLLVDSELKGKLEKKPAELKEILSLLLNLVESLGKLFHERLMDKGSREPRIISFAIKTRIADPLLEKVLNYAIQNAIFHKKWYRSKSGHEILECYILNRRLCPRYHLDLSSFQGRLEISESDINLACLKKDEFINKYKKEEDDSSQITLFDF